MFTVNFYEKKNVYNSILNLACYISAKQTSRKNKKVFFVDWLRHVVKRRSAFLVRAPSVTRYLEGAHSVMLERSQVRETSNVRGARAEKSRTNQVIPRGGQSPRLAPELIVFIKLYVALLRDLNRVQRIVRYVAFRGDHLELARADFAAGPIEIFSSAELGALFLAQTARRFFLPLAKFVFRDPGGAACLAPGFGQVAVGLVPAVLPASVVATGLAVGMGNPVV